VATDHDPEPVTFRNVLAIREFRALYVAQTLSVIGDQFARIAIASLIFARTGSALLTGVSYAISYLPWILGGPSLSVFADRLPRRSVMIYCDLGRLGLLAAAAMPGRAVWALLSVAGLAGVLQPPFTAARAALIPEIVGKAAGYKAASTLSNVTMQVAVVAGFGLGGIVASGLGAPMTLLIDALTFGISAAVVSRFVSTRPPATSRKTAWWREMTAGSTTVFRSADLRLLATSSWLVVGAAISTEAAAVPYTRSHGGGTVAAGLLTAALPSGTAVGAVLLARLRCDADAERWLGPLSSAAPLILVTTGLNPRPPIAAVVWFIAGGCSATTVLANRLFVIRVPDDVRARAFGVAAAGIAGAQGIGTLAVGILSARMTPAHAISVIAIAAFCVLVMITQPWSSSCAIREKGLAAARL
jgi:MFS family permease